MYQSRIIAAQKLLAAATGIGAAVGTAGEVGYAAIRSQGVPEAAAEVFRAGGMAALGTLIVPTVAANLFINNKTLKFAVKTLVGLPAFATMQLAQGIALNSDEAKANAQVIIPFLLIVLSLKNTAELAIAKKWPEQIMAAALVSTIVEMATVLAGGQLITKEGWLDFAPGANSFASMIVVATPIMLLMFQALAAIDQRAARMKAPIDSEDSSASLLAVEMSKGQQVDAAELGKAGEYATASPVQNATAAHEMVLTSAPEIQ